MKKYEPLETAPRDGTRILLYAELGADRAENAISGWLIARWNEADDYWRLSPFTDGAVIDSVHGWLPLPPEPEP